jgi:Secretion system C-terminal sorting domain
MKKPLLLLLFCITAKNYAQDMQWEKSFGGQQADYLMDAIPTADYGFILAGSSLSQQSETKTEASKGNYDYCIWKINENGKVEWQKSYGGAGNDMLTSVKSTNDGGYILAGTASPSPSKGGERNKGDHADNNIGQQDIWIIKLDAAGNIEWQKTIGGLADEQVANILQTKDGGYIIGASSESDKATPTPPKEGLTDKRIFKDTDSRGNLDYWIVKLNKKGELEWQKTMGGNYADILRSITQTQDGGYFVGGTSNSDASSPSSSEGRGQLQGEKTDKCYGNNDFWFMKLDAKGNIIWQQTYGADGDEQLYTVLQTADKNYMVAGNTNSSKTPGNNAPDGSDFLILKLDEKGNTIFEKIYNIGSDDILTNLVKNKDESLLLCGYSRSLPPAPSEGGGAAARTAKNAEGVEDYAVIKIDQNGEELWRKNIGKEGKNVLNKAIETRDGGYVLAGTSLPPAPSEGGGGATRTLNSVSNLGASKVAPPSGAGGLGADFYVVKLKDRTKQEVVKTMIEALPNPATTYTNIIVGYEYTNGTASLYDLGGRQLQSFAISSRTVPMDLTNLPEGIYIVNIETDKGKDGIKVIKQEIKR